MSNNTLTVKVLSQQKPYKVHLGAVTQEDGLMYSDNTVEVDMLPTPTNIPSTCKIFVKQRNEQDIKLGDFTPTVWNDPKGEVLEIRYLKDCRTLDKAWQDKNGFKPKSDEEMFGIDLNNVDYGDEIILENLPKNMLEYLNICTYNKNNKCAPQGSEDPSNMQLFEIFDAGAKLKQEIDETEIEIDRAEMLIKIAKDKDFASLSMEILNGVGDISIGADFDINRQMIIRFVKGDISNYKKALSVFESSRKDVYAKLHNALESNELIASNKDDKKLYALSGEDNFSVSEITGVNAKQKITQATNKIMESHELFVKFKNFYKTIKLN